MYLGTYLREVDAKGRFLVPSKLKARLEESIRSAGSVRDGELVMTLGFEKCLYLFPKSQWAAFVRKEIESRSELSRDIRFLKRMLASKAQTVEVDRQGRLLIPKDFLDGHLRLGRRPAAPRRVTVIGAMDHIEIWKEEAWAEFSENMQQEFDEIADKISRSGSTAV